MAITTSRTEKLYEAFSLDEEALRRIGLIVQAETYEKRWTVECIGGIRHYCATVEEVLKIPNVRGQEIKRIILRTSDNAPIQIEVDFRGTDRDTIGYIAYNIAGDSVTALVKSDEIRQFIIGQYEWYGRVSRLRWSSSFWFDALMLWISVCGIWFVTQSILWERRFEAAIKQPHFTSPLLLEAVLSWKVLLGVGLVALVVAASIQHLFPIANFLIGSGIDKYQRLKFVRYGIIGTLILGIISGVVSSAIHF